MFCNGCISCWGMFGLICAEWTPICVQATHSWFQGIAGCWKFFAWRNSSLQSESNNNNNNPNKSIPIHRSNKSLASRATHQSRARHPLLWYAFQPVDWAEDRRIYHFGWWGISPNQFGENITRIYNNSNANDISTNTFSPTNDSED